MPWGFIARRVLKGLVNTVIDEVVDDAEQAKEMKEGARLLITVGGIIFSGVTLDVVGAIDALTDHGTDMAVDHVTDMAIEQATIYYDPTDHIDHLTEYDGIDHTDHSEVKFGSGDGCRVAYCDCPRFIPGWGSDRDNCSYCGHNEDIHW